MRKLLGRRLLTDFNKCSPIDYLKAIAKATDKSKKRDWERSGAYQEKQRDASFRHHDAPTTDRENLTQTSRKWRVLDRRMRKIGSFSGNDEKSASSRKKTKSSSKLFCRWCLVYLRTYENERNIRVLSSASYVAWNHLAINEQTFLAKSKIRSSDPWMIQKRWYYTFDHKQWPLSNFGHKFITQFDGQAMKRQKVTKLDWNFDITTNCRHQKTWKYI